MTRSASTLLPNGPAGAARAGLIAVMLGLLACQAGTGPTDATRFGQVGEARLEVVTPRLEGEGELSESLTWFSSGEWRLTERISYREREGDAQTSTDAGLGAQGQYALWIIEVNDVEGLRLIDFAPLDESLDPDCGKFASRVTLTIRDDTRRQVRSWTRCAERSLGGLDPTGSGPVGDPAASRVIEAARSLRDRTVRAGFSSAYAGSLPFATLFRGEDLTADVPGGGVIRDADTWLAFWSAIAGSGQPPLNVDFEDEVVLIAVADSVRREAGDSIEIRRVLPIQRGTAVETAERRPGDFCSPAGRPHRPFHVAVSPEVSAPVTFTRPRIELVSC